MAEPLGELTCGNLRQRAEVLSLHIDLPQATAAHDAEVLFFIGRHESMGRGIDDVDVHTIHP